MRLLVTSLAALGACQPEPPAQAPEIVAFVDALPIRGEALMLRALRQYAVLDPQDWETVLERLLEDEIELQLLAQEARRQNIKLTPDAVERAVAALQRRYPRHRFRRALDRLALRPVDLQERAELRLLAQALLKQAADAQPVTEQAIAAWIAKHPTEEKVIVRHLLTASESDANKALSLLKKKRFSFADLVRRFSTAPEAQQGGLLPPYARGELPSVFDQAFSLKPGEVSQPLRSEHGWHVLKLERLQAQGRSSEDRARRAILRTREGALQGQLIARLRSASKIRKVPGALAGWSARLTDAAEAPK